ncbi:hypothetical protein Arno18_10 [Pectobacterium phage Arno18]|uniref:Uncharacterized protein n=1 Tax=Pectobacterium phage Arno18 TaxID=2500578 RepID=A0A679A2Q4_9CAUD|nr:hypothetical protein Arno18_10 [Pectobacterium phage Arno18]
MGMTFEQLLLTKVIEEASEVIKEAAKIQQFGMDSFNPHEPDVLNRERLVAELKDLFASARILCEASNIPFVLTEQDVDAKRAKILKYAALSRKLGTVDGVMSPIKRTIKVVWLDNCPRCKAQSVILTSAGTEKLLYSGDQGYCEICYLQGVISADEEGAYMEWDEFSDEHKAILDEQRRIM